MTKAKSKPSGGRTEFGLGLEEALKEVLAHVRGEITLPSRIVNVPQETDVRAIRARFKLSREKFAIRFGLDYRAVQEWEQGRRQPDRATRILLRVIEREPEAVDRALAD
ncbi:MAG: helix-turn-helix domain-containing protein [Stellaceae bacterium]